MGFRRVLALVISAMLLLTPMMASAEEYGFSAGDLTLATLSESYTGGYQVNVGFGFDVDTQALSASSERMKAAAVLLEKAEINLSFYDDFGTARIRGAMSLDGVDVLTGDMLVFEDGSVQVTTSLTGNMAFTLPAGTVTPDGIALPGMNTDWTYENAAEIHPFQRLKDTGTDTVTRLLNILLGWVSSTQMETGELYTFDYDTYIDATDVRDAVATRMIGKIEGSDMIRFLWSVAAHIRDREHEFQSALAYSIAELGVTRSQARQFTDALFPDAQIDYELYDLSPSGKYAGSVAPVRYADILYFFCKLEASLMNAWGENTLNEISSMIVSYDDFGDMVGFDAELRPFTKSYPFEGDFTYSIRTDDNWQRMHTSHGELQVQDDKRVIGDLYVQLGEDVDGVNASRFNGQLDVVDQRSGQSMGFGVNASLGFALAPDDAGESIEANADIFLNQTGESMMLIDADFSAVSQLTDLGLALSGDLRMSAAGLPTTAVNVNIECVEYEEEPFAGGQAVDLSSELTQEQIEEIKDTVKVKAAGLAAKFALKPAVLGNVLTLTKGFLE